MELRHIRYFKAVAEEKNFTRAAEKLAIAQPPLSRQIQDLEEELGTELFVRSPHKVALTEEGELFLQYATQILDLVNKSEEEVKEMKEGLQGTLYIASVEGCAPRLFAEWISAFRKKHPNVQYNLWNGNTDDVNNRVTKGLCEVEGKEYRVSCVSMGNPHVITYVDDEKAVDIEKIGPLFESHPVFPERTNTEFIRIADRKNIYMRVWERGTGETLACGTGACASAVATMLNGLCDRKVTVHLLGGDLFIEWDEKDNVVYMTGPAVTVFTGDYPLISLL